MTTRVRPAEGIAGFGLNARGSYYRYLDHGRHGLVSQGQDTAFAVRNSDSDVGSNRQSVGPENPMSTPPGARTIAVQTPSITFVGGRTDSAPAASAAS